MDRSLQEYSYAQRIGKTIKKYRQSKVGTQKELADVMHVSTKTVANWEHGWVAPNIERICQLADLFELDTIDELIDRKPPRKFTRNDMKAAILC